MTEWIIIMGGGGYLFFTVWRFVKEILKSWKHILKMNELKRQVYGKEETSKGEKTKTKKGR